VAVAVAVAFALVGAGVEAVGEDGARDEVGSENGSDGSGDAPMAIAVEWVCAYDSDAEEKNIAASLQDGGAFESAPLSDLGLEGTSFNGSRSVNVDPSSGLVST
jgi:hypothetical protein